MGAVKMSSLRQSSDESDAPSWVELDGYGPFSLHPVRVQLRVLVEELTNSYGALIVTI